MQIFNLQVFDEIIKGTSTTWYTPVQLNRVLGRADFLTMVVSTTLVGGTFPLLRITVEHSADGRAFVPRSPSGPEVPDILIGDGGNYTATTWLDALPMDHVRLAIILGGLSPECRLIVGMTGRDL